MTESTRSVVSTTPINDSDLNNSSYSFIPNSKSLIQVFLLRVKGIIFSSGGSISLMFINKNLFETNLIETLRNLFWGLMFKTSSLRFFAERPLFEKLFFYKDLSHKFYQLLSPWKPRTSAFLPFFWCRGRFSLANWTIELWWWMRLGWKEEFTI